VTPPLLGLEQVGVSYGGLTALSAASFDVEAGQCVVVLGPNGAGKSSLLKCIAGAVPPVAGTIRYKGQRVNKMSPDRRAASGITLVPEGRRIFPDLSVERNLQLPRATRRGTRQDFTQRQERVLEMFPVLGSRLRQPAGTLSGGEQQMLAIGRALMAGPELLMLDEPSNGLAPILVAAIFDQLKEISRAGVTILLAEQHAGALQIATFLHVLSGGHIIASGAPDAFSEGDAIMSAYLGVSS
jgi:branched-chain amino acid transport system ATP-binding protein